MIHVHDPDLMEGKIRINIVKVKDIIDQEVEVVIINIQEKERWTIIGISRKVGIEIKRGRGD